MIVLLLLNAALFANAAPPDQCRVGAWSGWTECISSKHCPSVPSRVFSYPMEQSAEWDSGRAKMEFIMKKKQEARKTREECIAAKTCPAELQRPFGGFFECDESGQAGQIPCHNVDQLSFLNFKELGYDPLLPPDSIPEGNDVWGWTDPDNGDEYALMGTTGGTAFVRVTDPINPVPVGFMYSQTVASIWRDIKVIGNYAFIGAEASNHGLQVFDLTRLRGRTTIEYFTPDARNTDFGNSHNIAANEDTNFLYVVGATQSANYPRTCGGGLFVIDVSDPLNPTTVGCFGGDGYVHDAQCVVYHGPDTRYTDHEICFCFNENSFTIVDVTDKAAMRVIAKTAYINVAYTHQGWVTEDHQVVLLDDELDEIGQPPNDQFTKTYVWDVTNLENSELKTMFESSQRSIDHNQYIIGDFSFQANYESGLRILHIDRATFELSQVAYFDVFPERTTAEFFGTWSVFPFFRSGTVLVSSIDYGLFVTRPNWPAINKLVASGATYAEQTRTRGGAAITGREYCPLQTESRICAAPVLC